MEMKTAILSVVVVILLVVSVVQAMQLASLKEKVGELKSFSGTSSSPSGAGSSLKQNLNNLPTMVGGC